MRVKPYLHDLDQHNIIMQTATLFVEKKKEKNSKEAAQYDKGVISSVKHYWYNQRRFHCKILIMYV